MIEPTESINSLDEQLLAAAATFSGDSQALADLLTRFARDVETALREPLEIFPVCHHSPASALQMVRRLRQRPPRVIYIELCEDMLPLVEHLSDCTLPVALQAFAAESDTLPPETLPVTVVAPLTESSAEYQAIAYALSHPETQLLFVDRAVDFVFQWDADWRRKTSGAVDGDDPPREEATMHGTAVGVTVGSLQPTFEAFLEFLLRNSNTRHFAEWWDQYVERSIIDADYASYRQLMFLVGSLIRHLGRRELDIVEDRLREKHMWTRMKQHLREQRIDPRDALYICGAAHAASDVPEFGIGGEAEWDIPHQSNTRWLYGLIPSSYAAIEYQFSHPAGTVSLAEGVWQKGLKAAGIKSFSLAKGASARREAPPASVGSPRALAAFLTQPPQAIADQEQLLGWCAQIVALARKNGYLASTADSIAIYQTALLLAQIRNRPHPSPYDFQDAAITCLEKDRTPRKRTIAQLCQILLGGDRIGTVGYASLPPLAQDIYDRLAPLQVDLLAKTNQRALMDFKARPELHACSALLWKLRYLLGDALVKPIVGERKLGFVPIQESWDIRIGKYQRDVIQLGYEGVTLEQVLEQRMKRVAFGEGATAGRALETAEDALLYMNSPRLVRELGQQATHLLAQEDSAAEAPEIFERARRLVHHYRSTADGLPDWIQRFVATGYAHYTALLPRAFGDRGTTPAQIAGMLGFIFTLESLALALGCQRRQLLISVQQSAQEEIPPEKIGLLWATEWLLNLRGVATMRAYFHDMLGDGLRLPTLPAYLSGFILALTFAPGIARLVVELLSEVFGTVPDRTLLPLLPGLIVQLRGQQQVLQPLLKEAAALFPQSLAGFAGWQPAWLDAAPTQPAATISMDLSADEVATRALLFAAPSTADALAAWLGIEGQGWQEQAQAMAGGSQPTAEEQVVRKLLEAAPATGAAVAGYLGVESES